MTQKPPPPTFIGEPNRPCRRNPDVTVCTQDLVDFIESWYVDESTETSSDHRYILFSLNLNPQKLELKRYKTKFTNFKKLNNNFKNHADTLNNNLDNIKTKEDFDNWLEDFNTKLTNTCNKSLKLKVLKLYPSFDWWNATLRSQRNKISALRKKYKISGDPGCRTRLQFERAKYKKQIKQEKFNSWRNFCSNT